MSYPIPNPHQPPLPPGTPVTYTAVSHPTSYTAAVPPTTYTPPIYPAGTPAPVYAPTVMSTTFNPSIPPPPLTHMYYTPPLPTYAPVAPSHAQATTYMHYPPPPPPSTTSYSSYPSQPPPPGMSSTEYPPKTAHPPPPTSHSRTWYAPRPNLTYRNPAIRSSSQPPPPPPSHEHRPSYRPRKPFAPPSSYRGPSTRPPLLRPSSSDGRSSSSSNYSSHHQSEKKPKKAETERDRLLKNWRSYFCETSEEIARKLAELEENEEKDVWIRSSPADIYYRRTNNGNEVEGTPRLEALCKLFDEELVKRADKAKAKMDPYVLPQRKHRRRLCKHKSEVCSSSSDSSDDEFQIEQDCCMEELSRKVQHPYRLHPDLWHNDPGEMNDGPLCRCSAKSRRIGIRHGIYPGEVGIPKCIPNLNNANKLYHYRITVSPPTNFLTKTPTIIKHDEHEFLFEGFSLFSHSPIDELPTCKVIRFNIEYTILYIAEKIPENFTIQELELFSKYLFHELLELADFSLLPNINTDTSCPAFHFLPRFVRDLADNGKEVLAMSEVLKYLLDNSGPLVDPERLSTMSDIGQNDWQDYVDYIKGMVVTKPGQKPCSVRIDQLDRNVPDIPDCVDKDNESILHPAIVHFGIRPPQLSYAGNPEYQKAWREYVKFRHLMANMSKPSYKDKRKLEDKEIRLQEMRTQGRMKRNITVAISSKGFYRTGIMCDVIQHAMLIPVLTGHLRFHQALNLLEHNIGYKFKNRYLLQLALTHPSYKENFGTNPDHARNSLTNCGIRQPEYGDRKIHYMNTRKRGINTLINIMSRFGKEYETISNITHNERLEFLGDAVVEFLSSIHLFFMFPDLEEGGLATYRAAIVQNQHLAVLSRKLQLEEYMLYAHGSDLCHELELRHAMANCFEALMGALLLDGGISVADGVFMNALFMGDETLKEIWKNLPEHPLQEQEPLGDRHCIASYPVLNELTKFEDSIGIKFKHIRLLARAFTDRSIGFTHLTLGSNQRLEFLGDTVLQLICSEYLYRHFPEHHEGHLSLLRSSLVNNRTQAVVCDDLGMTQYAVFSNPKADMKTKDRADLLEAFLGALYVDKGLMYCEQFCHVCLFPRLQMFIMNQDWNDPKSKLQQCCLTLRTMEGGEPDIPIYKVVESIGPTNTRIYTVAVYFRSKRLATATGHTIQQAEMNAAKQALENSRELFPQLDHQKRVIAKSIKRQTGDVNSDLEDSFKQPAKKHFADDMDESHLPKQYRVREDISSDELPDDDDDIGMESEVCVKTKKKKKKSHSSPKKKHKKKRKHSSVSCSESSERDSLKHKVKSSKKLAIIDDSLSPLSDEEIGDHIAMDPILTVKYSKYEDKPSRNKKDQAYDMDELKTYRNKKDSKNDIDPPATVKHSRHEAKSLKNKTDPKYDIDMDAPLIFKHSKDEAKSLKNRKDPTYEMCIPPTVKHRTDEEKYVRNKKDPKYDMDRPPTVKHSKHEAKSSKDRKDSPYDMDPSHTVKHNTDEEKIVRNKREPRYDMDCPPIVKHSKHETKSSKDRKDSSYNMDPLPTVKHSTDEEKCLRNKKEPRYDMDRPPTVKYSKHEAKFSRDRKDSSYDMDTPSTVKHSTDEDKSLRNRKDPRYNMDYLPTSKHYKHEAKSLKNIADPTYYMEPSLTVKYTKDESKSLKNRKDPTYEMGIPPALKHPTEEEKFLTNKKDPKHDMDPQLTVKDNKCESKSLKNKTDPTYHMDPPPTAKHSKDELKAFEGKKDSTYDLKQKICKTFLALTDVEDVSSSSEIESGEIST